MEDLKKIISEYADIEANDIDENMSLQGNIGIDSFGLVCMLMDIEEKFNVKIPDYELKNFHTLSDIDNYICSHRMF